jgi:Zn-finger nucleic acid-binding protein
MIILAYRGIEVDVCPQCRGAWFDAGEMEDLLARTGGSADDPALAFVRGTPLPPGPEKRLCPRCDERMQQHGTPASDGDQKDLVLDRCPNGHGVWFDGGEFRRLLLRFRPSGGAQGAIAFLQDMFGDYLGSTESQPDS